MAFCMRVGKYIIGIQSEKVPKPHPLLRLIVLLHCIIQFPTRVVGIRSWVIHSLHSLWCASLSPDDVRLSIFVNCGRATVSTCVFQGVTPLHSTTGSRAACASTLYCSIASKAIASQYYLVLPCCRKIFFKGWKNFPPDTIRRMWRLFFSSWGPFWSDISPRTTLSTLTSSPRWPAPTPFPRGGQSSSSLSRSLAAPSTPRNTRLRSALTCSYSSSNSTAFFTL